MIRIMKKNVGLWFGLLLLAALLTGCGGGGGGDSTGTIAPPPVDTTRPLVSSTTPPHRASSVFTNSAVAASFSEEMDPATINVATFIVKDSGAGAVQGTVTYDITSKAVIFAHGGLEANTLYTASVTTGARDLVGNATAADYTWSFTTGDTQDGTPPEVLFTFPVNNAIEVPLNTAVVVTFSEYMNPATVNTQTFTLWEDGAIPVAGDVTYMGTFAFFKPDQNLSTNNAYTVQVSAEAEDLAGNPMAGVYSFGFTTGSELDLTPPQVISVNPPDGATGVPLDASVDAAFNEAMLPFEYGLINGRPMAVTFDPTYTSVSMQPTGGLDSGRWTVSVQVRDVAGNRMISPQSWSFTTD